MTISIPAGFNLPANMNTNLNMGLPASMLGANTGTGVDPLSLPINPLGMDLNAGIAGFSAISSQITALGGLDSAMMKQLNNPTANPLSGQQSSTISAIMKEIGSGKFTQMAAEDKVKKAEDKIEEEEDDKDDKASDARKERLEEIRLQKEEAQLEMLKYLAVNAKQQQPQVQQPLQVQQGLQVQPQGAQQGQRWPSQSYTG
ncbi:MAG: hypothetical protein QE263_02205 [Vampirovibrionales bacterium]|nr:hypothetical protein [Vampirovibrionales bacterium]